LDKSLEILQGIFKDAYPHHRYIKHQLSTGKRAEFYYDSETKQWAVAEVKETDANILNLLRETDYNADQWLQMPFEMVKCKWLYSKHRSFFFLRCHHCLLFRRVGARKILLLHGYAYVPLEFTNRLVASYIRPWLEMVLQRQEVVSMPQKPYVPPKLETSRSTPNYAAYWKGRKRKTPPCDSRMTELQNGWHQALAKMLPPPLEGKDLQSLDDLSNSVPLPPCIRRMLASSRDMQVYPKFDFRQRLATFFLGMHVNPKPLLRLWSLSMGKQKLQEAERQINGLAAKRELTYGCASTKKAGYCVYENSTLYGSTEKCSAGLGLPAGKHITSPVERARLIVEKRKRGQQQQREHVAIAMETS
jgi:hypothetical protein